MLHGLTPVQILDDLPNTRRLRTCSTARAADLMSGLLAQVAANASQKIRKNSGAREGLQDGVESARVYIFWRGRRAHLPSH